jgi:phage/plasmid-associated DNA primase
MQNSLILASNIINKCTIPYNDEEKKAQANYRRLPTLKRYGCNFNLDTESEFEFLKHWGNCVIEKKQQSWIQLSEEFGPFRIDIDIKKDIEYYNNDIRPAFFNKSLCKEFCTILHDILYKLYDDNVLNSIDFDPNIIIMLKDKPKLINNGKIVKDGMHIMLPGIIVDCDTHMYIRELLLDNLTDMDFFNDQNLEDVVDKNMYRKKSPWTLYGCSKSSKMCGVDPPYLIRYVYDLNNVKLIENNISIVPNIKNNEIPQYLSIHGKYDRTQINKDILNKINNKINKKPAISINKTVINGPLILLMLDLIDNINIQKRQPYGGSANSSGFRDLVLCCLSISKSHVSIINKLKERFKNKPNIDNRIDSFVKTIRDSFNWKCERLINWSAEDDLKNHKKIMNKHMAYEIYLSIKHNELWQSEYKYASYLQKITGDNFRSQFDKTGKCTLYEFKDHIWNRCNGDSTIKQKIYNELSELYTEVLHLITSEKMNTDNAINDKLKNTFSDKNINNKSLKYAYKKIENEANESNKNNIYTINLLRNVINKNFRSNSGSNAITKTFKENIDYPMFSQKLDLDINLLAFNDGILELTHPFRFRPGRKDDMLSQKISYNYPKPWEKVKDTEPAKSMVKILKDIHGENYTWKMLTSASFLPGNRTSSLVYIDYGLGGNGKSVFYTLMKLALDVYFGIVDAEYFVGKTKQSGQATPEIMQVRKCRLLLINEAPKHSRFNMKTVKTTSGNELMGGRDLYEPFVYFVPMWRIIFQVNSIPGLNEFTHSSERRFIVNKYLKTFKENPNPELDEIQLDCDILSDIQSWGPLMMSLLMYLFINNVYGKKIKTPESVLRDSMEFVHRDNHIGNFVKQKIKKSEDVNNKITLLQIKRQFDAWKNIYVGIKYQVNMNSLKEYLEENFKTTYIKKSSLIIGYEFIEDQEGTTSTD